MDDKNIRARQIQKEISEILFEFWDPIGLNDALPRGEYDAYVGRVYRALSDGKGELGVVRLLTDIENTYIGCRASYAQKQEAAKRLCALNVRLNEP